MLNALVGEGHRLDHMPLILCQRYLSEGSDLHGGRVGPSGNYNRELAYHYENGRPYCTLMVRWAYNRALSAEREFECVQACGGGSIGFDNA